MSLRNGMIVLLLLSMAPAFGQKTVQVITKRVEKDFSYQEDYEVNIEGDRAEVYIETSQDDKIHVQLDLIARHPDKEVAEADLERMRYLAQRVKNKIYLRNYLSLKDTEAKPESQLVAIYHIQLPESCPVYLKNNFGVAEVRNLNNSLKVNSRFSRIGLENIEGAVDVTSKFGDLLGENLDGTVRINAKRTDLTLRNIKGSYDINAEYGIVQVFAGDGLLDFNLKAEKSDVYLHNMDLGKFSYNLTAQNGRIMYPDELEFNMIEPQPQIKKVTFKPQAEYYPSITISVAFGDVYLTKQ